jgi:hypothetical protein
VWRQRAMTAPLGGNHLYLLAGSYSSQQEMCILRKTHREPIITIITVLSTAATLHRDRNVERHLTGFVGGCVCENCISDFVTITLSVCVFMLMYHIQYIHSVICESQGAQR